LHLGIFVFSRREGEAQNSQKAEKRGNHPAPRKILSKLKICQR
jgi:hypothetical protein